MEAFYDLTQHRLYVAVSILRIPNGDADHDDRRPFSNDHMESAEGMALALFTYARPAV
jgi:hypothetical protein